MQRTKSKLLSILLSLVMLLSLLPTTALAADTYPTASEVCVDGSKYFGEPGSYYFRNNESACSKNSTGYNAYYNPTTGTLTLNGYNGGSITVGGTKSKITVVLVGDNTITNGSLTSAGGGDITVTSDSSGTLSISKTTSGSNAAIGIETGLSASDITGNVTIKGDAKVTIKMTHNGTKTYDKAYGIFAKENITISENASVDITCATPNNTTGGDRCNGLYAAQNVTIDTNGTIKIDVTKAGKDDGYSFGVYPMGKATLTKVGNMEVQWKKHATHSSYPGGVVYKGASLSDTDYAINEDTTNCYASYRKGTPYTVTVEYGTLAGTGVVSHANNNGNFLAGDTVEIKPSVMKGKSGEVIPFKEWTPSDVAFTSPATTENNSFTVPANAVTVTAKHNPFVGAPTFTPKGTTGTEGTLTFTTVVDPYDGSEGFYLVKEADVDTTSKYISINPSKTSTGSPYEYSSTVNFNNFPAGNYYVAEKLNGAWYLSDLFAVNYTAASTPTATVADVTIDGKKGSLISNKEVEITLTNDTFESALSGNWITNLPTGLSQSLSRTDDTHAKITVSGNPSVASSDALAITIPAANLVTSTSDLDVASNANAKFEITAPTYSVNIVAGANMNTTGTANQTGLTGAMTNVVYTADTGYYFPTSYSSIGTSDGVTVTRDSYTQITVSGTPTGNVNITLADATAKTKEATPTATFAAESENGGKLSSVDNTMKYSVDGGGTWVDITGDNMSITNVTTANGVQVKKPATDSNTMLDSDVKTITVTKATAPTGVTAVGCTSSSNNDGKLQNVTTAMEYQKSGATAWTPGTGSDISGLTNGTYYVRVKANGTELASDNQSVTINAYSSLPSEATPSATFTATGPDSGTLSGVDSGLKYQINSGAWTDITSNADVALTGLSACTINVVKKGNGTTTTDSAAQTITVTKATTPSTVTAVDCTTSSNNNGKLQNVTTAMEYQKSGAAWTACGGTEVSGLTNGTYLVRVKANGTELASDNQTVVIAAYVAPTEYTITFDVNGGIGTIASQTTSGKKLSSLPTATHSGSYSFAGWYDAISGGNQITTAYTFSADTTVYAHWTYIGGGGGGGSYTPSYTVSVDKTENGTITVSPKSASKGDTVTITVKPDKGYELDTLKVLDKNGDKVKLTEKNGKYTFTMPTGKVAVKGSFVEEAPEQIFKDVPTDAYYYEAVKWAAEKGITGGVGNGLFAPNQPCTRAQIVTFLWRAAGSPAPKNTGTAFGDVKPGSFYEQAVAWAVENGITGGTSDGMFSPDATCTRAQSVTFLYRAAGSPAVSGSAEFGDVATNAYYADAVAWAAKNGITGGIGGGQFGSGNDCTRGQIVTFLYRAYNK